MKKNTQNERKLKNLYFNLYFKIKFVVDHFGDSKVLEWKFVWMDSWKIISRNEAD